jgi:hypothetical protein
MGLTPNPGSDWHSLFSSPTHRQAYFLLSTPPSPNDLISQTPASRGHMRYDQLDCHRPTCMLDMKSYDVLSCFTKLDQRPSAPKPSALVQSVYEKKNRKHVACTLIAGFQICGAVTGCTWRTASCAAVL